MSNMRHSRRQSGVLSLIALTVVIAVGAALYAQAGTVSATTSGDDPCVGDSGGGITDEECVPPPPCDPPTIEWGQWSCSSQGTVEVNDNGTIDEEETICVEDAANFSPPDIDSHVDANDGEKERVEVCTENCADDPCPPDSQLASETEDVSYTVDSWWETSTGAKVTDWEAELDEPGIYVFTAKAKGVSGDSACDDTSEIDVGTLEVKSVQITDVSPYENDDPPEVASALGDGDAWDRCERTYQVTTDPADCYDVVNVRLQEDSVGSITTGYDSSTGRFGVTWTLPLTDHDNDDATPPNKPEQPTTETVYAFMGTADDPMCETSRDVTIANWYMSDYEGNNLRLVESDDVAGDTGCGATIAVSNGCDCATYGSIQRCWDTDDFVLTPAAADDPEAGLTWSNSGFIKVRDYTVVDGKTPKLTWDVELDAEVERKMTYKWNGAGSPAPFGATVKVVGGGGGFIKAEGIYIDDDLLASVNLSVAGRFDDPSGNGGSFHTDNAYTAQIANTTFSQTSVGASISGGMSQADGASGGGSVSGEISTAQVGSVGKAFKTVLNMNVDGSPIPRCYDTVGGGSISWGGRCRIHAVLTASVEQSNVISEHDWNKVEFDVSDLNAKYDVIMTEDNEPTAKCSGSCP